MMKLTYLLPLFLLSAQPGMRITAQSQSTSPPRQQSIAAPQEQQDDAEQLLQALRLYSTGRYQSAAAILQPFTAHAPATASTLQLGTAWNLLGSSNQYMGNLAEAQHNYQQAIHLLTPLTQGQSELASSLDNLGSLENLLNHPDASKALRLRARKLYQQLNDHAGMARTTINLAVVSLAQNKAADAQRYLDEALQQAVLAPTLDADDRAAMLSVQGSLHVRNHQYIAAIQNFQECLGLWTRAHGDHSYLVGLGQMLAAQAYAGAGDFPAAEEHIQQAISIQSESGGTRSQAYLRALSLQADILKRAGHDRHADKVLATFSSLKQQEAEQPCLSCTVSIESLRK